MRLSKYFPLALALAGVVACAPVDPYEGVEPAEFVGITSITARFTQGPSASDPSAVFSARPDENGNIVLEIPWYFPTASDNEVDPEWLKSLKVSAALQAGTFVEPAFGLLDLSKENFFKATDPVGRTKNFSVIARIVKFSGCSIEAFRLSSNGTDYDAIVSEDKGTLSIITPLTELKQTTLSARLSDHANLSGYTEGMTIRGGEKFTVTAQDGVHSKEYTLDFSIPEKIGYGINRDFKEYWKKWYKSNLDISIQSGPIKLAASGDYLIVSNSGKLYVLNRFTGAYIKTLSFPGYDIKSITNDDAGHILFSNEVLFQQSEPFEVYYIDSIDDALPKKLCSYVQLDFYNSRLSNIKCSGDVTSHALVTAFASVNNMGVYWTIENGSEVSKAWTKNFRGDSGNTPVNGVYNGCVVSATTDPADGFFGVGYGKDYSIRYYKTADQKWSSVYTTGSIGNENPCALSVGELNGARYLLFGSGAHFAYSFDPKNSDKMIVLMDCSEPLSTGQAVMASYTRTDMAPGTFTSTGTACDVLLVPSTDGYKMHAYYTEGAFDVLCCLEFDCIKR